jgi:hypothetical protein
MTESILDSVKETLGVPVDSTSFDQELILYINAALSDLNQLGVGPKDGFAITDKTAIWGDFLTNTLKMNDARTYAALRVKLLFDPPSTSFVIAAIQEQLKESAWRLNAKREETDWVNPDPVDPVLSDDPFADAPA